MYVYINKMNDIISFIKTAPEIISVGTEIPMSSNSDGTIVAIGNSNILKVFNTKFGVTSQIGTDKALDDGTAVITSVSLSADGTIVACSHNNVVNIYQYTNSWGNFGGIIDLGLVVLKVSLSADGKTVAIGAKNTRDGNKAFVRVYVRDASKNSAQLDQTQPNYGPVGWNRVGGDLTGASDTEMSSLSLSGDGTTVAIGSVVNQKIFTGHVRVYERDASNAWVQLGGDIEGGSDSDYLGKDVSLSFDGRTVAIAGTVSQAYLFCSSGSGCSWEQLQGIEDGGYSVSLSSDGTTMAVGNYIGRLNGGGVVNVYGLIMTVGSYDQADSPIFDSKSWVKLSSKIISSRVGTKFGYNVSLSANGETIVIGEGDYGQATVTAIKIYKKNLNYLVKLNLALKADLVELTTTVSGNKSDFEAADALLRKDLSDLTTATSFAVDLTKTNLSTPQWLQLGSDIDGELYQDQSGHSVSLSADGTTMAIGASYNDGNGSNSGHVRVYVRDASKLLAQTDQTQPNYGPVGWNRVGGDIDGESGVDNSGYSVSLSDDGTIVAIGAIYNDGVNGSNSGHVRVYVRDAGKISAEADQTQPNYGPVGWNRVGGDIDGEAKWDNSGYSVSLSGDGTTVAIGSRYNTGVNGSNSGHVRVYVRDAGKISAEADQTQPNYGPIGWNRVGEDINGEASDDQSGHSVSLSYDGTIVAIGARYNDGVSLYNRNFGHVRVYEINANNAWVQVGTDIDGEAFDDSSGYSVSLSGDGTTVAIGAPFNDDNGSDSGHVRVYARDASNANGWVQVGGDIDGEARGDQSGGSVSLSADGTIVAIGAPLKDNANWTYSGHVRIYVQDPNEAIGWRQVGEDINGETNYDQSGQSVSLSADGTTVAIGAPRNDGNGTSSGHVRVYKIGNEFEKIISNLKIADTNNNSNLTALDGVVDELIYDTSFAVDLTKNDWRQVGADINGVAADDDTGYSVSLSKNGKTMAIGARYNDAKGSDSGHVRVYVRDPNNANNWNQLGGDIEGEAAGDESGYSVSLSGDGTTVAIGARYNDGVNGSDSGHVRVYVRDARKLFDQTDQTQPNYGPVGWNRVGEDIDGEAKYDESGNAVTLSYDGTIVAIGAIGNDGNGTRSGHVRVYVRDASNNWNQLGGDIDGERDGDKSGYSVSLSGDGTTVAIGAIYNDGVNGENTFSGHVRVYEFVDVVGNIPAYWSKVGTGIVGELVYIQSGFSVSLSADGTTVAIGAPYNDGVNGENHGHVRLYVRDPNEAIGWRQVGEDIDGEDAGDNSGYSVSLSDDGTIVAIGARYNDGVNGSNSGHVRVYKRDARTDSWRQVGTDIDGEAANDLSGYSVSLSGDGKTVAIGAPLNDGNGSNSGHARVYELDPDNEFEKIISNLRDADVTLTNKICEVDKELNGVISKIIKTMK